MFKTESFDQMTDPHPSIFFYLHYSTQGLN